MKFKTGKKYRVSIPTGVTSQAPYNATDVADWLNRVQYLNGRLVTLRDSQRSISLDRAGWYTYETPWLPEEWLVGAGSKKDKDPCKCEWAHCLSQRKI
jgi:hypothetical protein